MTRRLTAKPILPLTLALFAATAYGQHAAKSPTVTFAPLQTWKAAVLSGNSAALQGLYSTNPPAVTLTSKAENHDPAAEPQFWLAVKQNGLRKLRLRVKTLDSPQAGVRRVTFELEADMNPDIGAPKIFAAVAQYWQEQDRKWRIVVTQRTALARLPQPLVLLLPEPKGDQPGSDPIYPPAGEAKADIAAALASAARDHKRVLLDFGGNWCSDCHILNATFHYPDVARILKPNYVLVEINIGQYDANLDLADKYQIPLKKGVPSLAVLDSDGRLLVSQKNGDFENTTRIGLKDVESFLTRWKP